MRNRNCSSENEADVYVSRNEVFFTDVFQDNLTSNKETNVIFNDRFWQNEEREKFRRNRRNNKKKQFNNAQMVRNGNDYNKYIAKRIEKVSIYFYRLTL